MIFQFKNEYRWLSNFYPCELIFRGKRYASVEYAYMSAKSVDKAWKMMCAEATEKQYIIKKKSLHLDLVPGCMTPPFVPFIIPLLPDARWLGRRLFSLRFKHSTPLVSPTGEDE